MKPQAKERRRPLLLTLTSYQRRKRSTPSALAERSPYRFDWGVYRHNSFCRAPNRGLRWLGDRECGANFGDPAFRPLPLRAAVFDHITRGSLDRSLRIDEAKPYEHYRRSTGPSRSASQSADRTPGNPDNSDA